MITAWRWNLNHFLHVFNLSFAVRALPPLSTKHLQMELVMNTHVAVSEVRQEVVNARTAVTDDLVNINAVVTDVRSDVKDTHTIVSTIHNNLVNTNTVVSNVHHRVVNTHAMVADIYRNVVKGHEGAIQSVSATCTPSISEKPLTLILAQVQAKSAASTSSVFATSHFY